MLKLPFKAIAFDIDDTLTASKQPLESDMATVLSDLTHSVPVAIISGAKKEQILTQLISHLQGQSWENLYLFPNGGAGAFTFDPHGQEKEIYNNAISEEARKNITSFAEKVIEESGINKGCEIFGDVIEFRGASIAISLLGQQATPEAKKSFDPDGKKRLAILPRLEQGLPEFTIKIGGWTTVDINQKGIDKAYGMREFAKILSLPEEDIMYVGDALYEGGNDSAVLTTGVMTHQVKNPADTLAYLRSILYA